MGKFLLFLAIVVLPPMAGYGFYQYCKMFIATPKFNLPRKLLTICISGGLFLGLFIPISHTFPNLPIGNFWPKYFEQAIVMFFTWVISLAILIGVPVYFVVFVKFFIKFLQKKEE